MLVREVYRAEGREEQEGGRREVHEAELRQSRPMIILVSCITCRLMFTFSSSIEMYLRAVAASRAHIEVTWRGRAWGKSACRREHTWR